MTEKFKNYEVINFRYADIQYFTNRIQDIDKKIENLQHRRDMFEAKIENSA